MEFRGDQTADETTCYALKSATKNHISNVGVLLERCNVSNKHKVWNEKRWQQSRSNESPL